MVGDGMSLASIEHPLDVEHVNVVAKAIAAGMGFRQAGSWALCLKAATAAIRADMDWQAMNEPTIDPTSLEQTTIDLPTGTVVKQAVGVLGLRVISRHETEDIGLELAIARARIDLQETFDVWLSINAPVWEWREEPMIDHARDFMYDRLVVQIYARGWLDIDVRLADHRAWLVELP